MKSSYIIFLALCLCGYLPLFSQHTNEYFISVNGNFYLPRNDEKGVYPILGYDKTTKPKILIGGFGIGFSALHNIRPKLTLKGQANISRSVYWETFTFRKGPNLSDITGSSVASSTDYTLGVTGIAHYQFTKWFSYGTGLGVQTMIVSALYLRSDLQFSDHPRRFVGYNRYYKPLMPVIPLEFSLRFEKVLINVRYEHALLNRFKKDLSNYKSDRYGLLFFEVGFRIK